MRPLIASLLAVLVCSASVRAQSVLGDGFEKGDLKDYLQGNLKGVSLAPAEGTKGRCLQIARGTQGTFKLAKLPVVVGKKNLLTFRARVVGDDVIEKNSRIDVMQAANANLLIRWQVHFLDANGKPLPKPRNFGILALVSGNWRTCTDVFYPPADAVAAQVAFVLPSGENGLMLDDVTLGPCPDEGAINCNPDFRYGPCNYAGWAHINTGGLLVEVADGQYGLDSAYGSSGEAFPLREPGTYRLSARGTVRGGFHTVDLRLCDEKGALIKTRSLSATPQGVSSDFVLPEGTASASLLVYNHILEEVRLVRMGDASKLAELDAARQAEKRKK